MGLFLRFKIGAFENDGKKEKIVQKIFRKQLKMFLHQFTVFFHQNMYMNSTWIFEVVCVSFKKAPELLQFEMHLFPGAKVGLK